MATLPASTLDEVWLWNFSHLHDDIQICLLNQINVEMLRDSYTVFRREEKWNGVTPTNFDSFDMER